MPKRDWEAIGRRHGEWLGKWFFWCCPAFYVEAWKSIKREFSR
jgi:hypothetical protein